MRLWLSVLIVLAVVSAAIGGTAWLQSPLLIGPSGSVKIEATGDNDGTMELFDSPNSAGLTLADLTRPNWANVQEKSVAVNELADGTDGRLITWGSDAAATTVAAGTDSYPLVGAGAGAPPNFEQLKTDGIADNAVTLAKMVHLAANKLYGTNGSGVPDTIDIGSGLTLSGSSLSASGGGGAIKQVKFMMTTTERSTSSEGWLDTTESLSITPTATANGLLIIAWGDVNFSGGKDWAGLAIYEGASRLSEQIFRGNTYGGNTYGGTFYGGTFCCLYAEEGSIGTSARTFKLYYGSGIYGATTQYFLKSGASTGGLIAIEFDNP